VDDQFATHRYQETPVIPDEPDDSTPVMWWKELGPMLGDGFVGRCCLCPVRARGSANLIAAYCHDYILVSSGQASDAMAVFRQLAANHTS